MDERNILDKLLEEQNGYIRLIDAQNEGVSKYSVLDYIRKNEMEKIAPGIYISPEAWEDRLYLIQLRNRKIVFSHETALYIHNLSDREPFIMEGHEYESIRFMIECTTDKLKQTIKTDISTGDEITPRAIAYKLPLIIEDRLINLWAYNLETLLAEKLETIMVRAEANTRMRDFYDIHVLLEQDVVTIDRDTMKSAFYATCKRRESTERIVMIDDVINKIADDEVMKQQWKNYRKNNYYVGTLEWDDVIGRTRTLRIMVE